MFFWVIIKGNLGFGVMFVEFDKGFNDKFNVFVFFYMVY